MRERDKVFSVGSGLDSRWLGSLLGLLSSSVTHTLYPLINEIKRNIN